MSREPDWKAEIRDALRKEPWSLTGAQRLVKVVRMRTMMNTPERARAVGYVTQELYLFGKTPYQIERAAWLASAQSAPWLPGFPSRTIADAERVYG